MPVSQAWQLSAGVMRMTNSDEIVPSLAEHTILVVMLFTQQCGVGTLPLAAFPWGGKEPCVPGCQYCCSQ